MQKKNYQEQIEEIRTAYNEQIKALDERIYTLEQELKKIQANNIRFEQELRKQAELYGVKVENLKPNPDYTFKIQDENGGIQELRRMDEETVKNELSNKKQMSDSLNLFRNKEISQLKKEEREEKIQEYNRKGIIEEARKFFTYLDTDTTVGTKYSTLTDDQLIDFYKSFYDNRDKPGYRKIWNDTMEKMAKNDRNVDEFYISSLIKDYKNKGMSEEDSIKEAINQFQERYPGKGLPEKYAGYIKQQDLEVYGPPTPEGYTEYPNSNVADEPHNKEGSLQEFNNNSTTLLTEGQILALRNRGYKVPFNKPGQTKLTDEQIRVINSAGISTVDLTEPGSKTVEELTGMPDPTQPTQKTDNNLQHIVREYVEIPKQLANKIENLFNSGQKNNNSEGQLHMPDNGGHQR